MIFTLVVCSLTVVLMVLSIIIKPYFSVKKIKIGLYAVITFVGAIIILVSGTLPFKVFTHAITENSPVNPLKILALFLSMSLISIYLGETGFFVMIAEKLFQKNKGGSFRLFAILYFTVGILTLFTSNDIIILTFTPIICVFCKKAKISPVPFLFGEFISANTFSMAFIIGNPTNLYLAGASLITFTEYLKVMFLPTLLGSLVAFFTLVIIFKKQLFGEKMQKPSEKYSSPVKKIPMVFSLVVLLLTLVFLAVSDLIGVESYLICVVGLVILTIIMLVYNLIVYHDIKGLVSVFKKAPYELIPFVLSMFTLVASLEYNGITSALSNVLLTGNKTDAISFSFLSLGSANLLNNIPMSVLFEKIVASENIYALYGSIIGSNVGAFLTPVGALAGIMWSKILERYNVKVKFTEFFKYGFLPAILTTLVTALTLMMF